MKVPVLVMAGGKGSRMGLSTEKPLLPFLGKPLIDWVAEAILEAKKVSEFYVITSTNTPQTEQYCQKKGWKILHTDAKGYHNDLKQAVSEGKFDWPNTHYAFRCSSHNRTGCLTKSSMLLRSAEKISWRSLSPSKQGKIWAYLSPPPTNTREFGTLFQESTS